ncbi:MAG: hypothetical protein JW771_02360 [Candidatus Thermoplasmatota archaeon]|nr:hypothetical protein [Candidatus Thermoplasmatota archaeon]
MVKIDDTINMELDDDVLDAMMIIYTKLGYDVSNTFILKDEHAGILVPLLKLLAPRLKDVL